MTTIAASWRFSPIWTRDGKRLLILRNFRCSGGGWEAKAGQTSDLFVGLLNTSGTAPV